MPTVMMLVVQCQYCLTEFEVERVFEDKCKECGAKGLMVKREVTLVGKICTNCQETFAAEKEKCPHCQAVLQPIWSISKLRRRENRNG